MIDVFNDFPSREIMIRVKGREIPGNYGAKITRKLIENPDLFANSNKRRASQFMSIGSSYSLKAPVSYHPGNDQGGSAIPIQTLDDDPKSIKISKIGDINSG